MAKEIKTALKEAREFYKNKDFPSTIEKCNFILKEDDKHYMALILIGAAYQDIDKKQSVKFLRTALTCTKEPPIVALQGLANCEEPNKLPDIYEKLLTLTPEKYLDLYEKLVTVALKLDNPSICIELFENETKHSDTERSDNALLSLSKIFIKQKDIPEKYNEIYEKSLKKFLNTNQNTKEVCECYKNFINFLYKQKNYVELLMYCEKMYDNYPDETFSIEWLLKVFIEKYSKDNNLIKHFLKKNLNVYINGLLASNEKSLVGEMAKAIFLFNNEDYALARDSLLKVNEIQENWSTCLSYLYKTHIKLNALVQAEFLMREKLKLNNALLIKVLVDQETKDKSLEAIKICKEILPSVEKSDEQSVIIENLARALFQTGQQDAFTKTIEKLTDRNFDEKKINLLKALKFSVLSIDEGIKFLVDNPDETFDYYLLMSKLLLRDNNISESLNYALKATKLQPYNSLCYDILGEVYKILKDPIRSLKCYKKCLYLNQLNSNAIIAVSTDLRKNNDWINNKNLLESIINNTINGRNNKILWMQLSLNYFEQRLYDKTIESLRSCLRCDINDNLIWELLSDAYYKRGSYNSAMKVYQKTYELNKFNFYSKLQVANIKMLLKMFNESIISFTEILNETTDYYPAYKGIAEAYYGLALNLFKQRRLGSCRDYLQLAADKLTEILQKQRNFSCLWRLLSNILNLAATLSNKFAFLYLPQLLINDKSMDINTNEKIKISDLKLFTISGNCMCRAIKLNKLNNTLWLELSINYYLRVIYYQNVLNFTERKNLLNLAIDSCKYSIKLIPNKWESWNLLGVLCVRKEINNLPLSQHCFIKSLLINRKNSITWTNLGVLYLKNNNINLANKSFKHGQENNINYLNCWLGQAIIAYLINENDESVDLYRHCTNLDYHKVSSIGYANWICNIIKNIDYVKNSRHNYIIQNMFGIQVATDCITWHCSSEDIKTSVESYAFLGFLNYKQNLFKNSARAYSLASEKATGIQKDVNLLNLGYSYLKLEEPLNAIKAFSNIEDQTFKSIVGLALAYFKASDYEKSYEIYQCALENYAKDDTEKSYILIAMSAMLYAFQGEQDAKTLLFQCISLPDPPIEGLFSACALGLLHEDLQLAELVLKELNIYEDNVEYSHHVVFFKSQMFLLTKKPKQGLMYILSMVHKYPARSNLRKILTNYILKNFRNNEKYLLFANHMSQSTILLDLRRYQSKSLNCSDAAKQLAIASASMRYVNQRERKLLAQRAVHINPTNKEAWSSLIACL